MNDSGGGFGSFLRSFAQAFLKSAMKRGSGTAPKRTGAQPGIPESARLSDPRNSASTAPVERQLLEGASPGQFGSGATRDLTRNEIVGLRPSYGPQPDGDPDPGEIVWTWVPYVENDGRGKDRPVLIIARIDHETTAGCYLSTKRHDGFVSVGTGPWDSQGRESFLSPERILRVTNEGMRRVGHVLPRAAFARAVGVVGREWGFAAR